MVARMYAVSRDRIEDAQIGLRDEFQDLLLRQGRAGGQREPEREPERAQRRGNDLHGDLPFLGASSEVRPVRC